MMQPLEGILPVPAWAAGPLDGDADRALSTLETGMQVSLIATFDLLTCWDDQHIDEVRETAALQDIDFVPVKSRKGSGVVGLFHRAEAAAGSAYRVREMMRPLHESILISSDAPLLAFVEDADRAPCRMVLRGRTIAGIVTLSDLQKLAVRMVLFSHITHLELLLAQWLRRCSSEEQWLDKLTPDQRRDVNRQWERLKKENLAIDKSTATTLKHKFDAALALGVFAGVKDAAEKTGQVNDLRHSIAHAREYGFTREGAIKVAAAARHTRELMGEVRQALHTQPPGPQS